MLGTAIFGLGLFFLEESMDPDDFVRDAPPKPPEDEAEEESLLELVLLDALPVLSFQSRSFSAMERL